MKKLIVLAASRLFPGRSPMKITRRFALAVLLVVAVAVVLGAPAPASAGKVKGTQVTLYPPADSPSPNATGTVTLYPVDSRWPIYPGGYSERVFVSVSKLAPNASYYMPVTVTVLDTYTGWNTRWTENVLIQTDAHGKGGGVWIGGLDSGRNYRNYYYITSVSFQVYNASGTLVLTSNR